MTMFASATHAVTGEGEEEEDVSELHAPRGDAACAANEERRGAAARTILRAHVLSLRGGVRKWDRR